MNTTLPYRLSIILTILLSQAAFITFLGWTATLITQWGSAPAFALIPWTPLGLVLLTALNCSLRAARFKARVK